MSILVFSVFFSNCKAPKKKELTIAAASSMQFVLEELTEAFKKQSGVDCKLVTGASGMLTSQITKGAPYHMLLSADAAYPEYLFDKGYAMHKPESYAWGELVIWTTKEKTIEEIRNLSKDENKIIAVANPKTAPYGKAAMEVLRYYQKYDIVKEQLVFGESISQTNQFISSGAVSFGFTSKSVVIASGLKEKGVWKTIDPSAYDPIVQTLVILKSDPETEKKAVAFKEFLFSNTGRRILEKYGYRTINK